MYPINSFRTGAPTYYETMTKKGKLLTVCVIIHARRLIHQLKLLVEHHQLQPLPTANQGTNKATTIYNSQLRHI